MNSPISTELAAVEERKDSSPRNMIMRYSDELTKVMPSHVEGEAWLRLAAGALKTGKMVNGEFELEIAARNNPAAFMQALRHAASQGLQPGTPQFYLTPRRVKGRLEILGVTGYQGIIELMYRAGYVTAVVAEVVYEGEEFKFDPGYDDRPLHQIDWRGRKGKFDLVYAFARMYGGGTSRVVILNQDDIDRIKKSSQGSDSEYSPWQTATKAMWLKSAVRQLQKWVPTSVHIMGQGGAPIIPNLPGPIGQVPLPDGHQLQVHDPDEVVDGELMEDAPVKDVSDLPEAEPEPPAVQPTGQAVDRMNPNQQRTMISLFNEKGIKSNEGREQIVRGILKIEGVFTPGEMTSEQARQVIAALRELQVTDAKRGQMEEPPASEEDAAVDALAEEAERESAG